MHSDGLEVVVRYTISSLTLISAGALYANKAVRIANHSSCTFGNMMVILFISLKASVSIQLDQYAFNRDT